jgi:hypothetical protein
MLLSRHQNAGHNHNIEIANRSYENYNTIEILGEDSKVR